MKMTRKKILYISGSVGLGHVIRDLAIARELRNQNPEIEISWLASQPASLLLRGAGEKLLPEANLYANENIPFERAARGTQLILPKYLSNAWGAWEYNVEIFKKVTDREQFDLVIGDETYEITFAFTEKPNLKKAPFVMIYDFVGLDSMTKNPLEKLRVYICNRFWAGDYRGNHFKEDLALFVGELEDVPDRSFGFLLPNRRDYARKMYKFVGYVFAFDSAEYADKAKIRAKLGYGEEPLIVCSIGGTSIGKEMLELGGQAYPIIKEEIPDLRMVLVCGPRLPAESLEVPQGVEVRGYVPALYEHFAASDLAIVQGGGSTTLELTALRRPFLYFPLEGHCEQQIHIARRLARHQAGVKMLYSQTTPTSLAEKVISTLGKEVTYAPIPSDGAQRAAQLINQLL
jgi:UDP-N-acetylglucosamine:LPS N-acetylglucosamine transferase